MDVHAEKQNEPGQPPMRHIACQARKCINKGAAYHDYEPADTAVPCPVCGTVMKVIEKPEPPADSDTIETDA